MLRDGSRACCACAHRRRASPLTCLAICLLVLTYNLLGGFLFLALEGEAAGAGEDTAVAASAPGPAPARALRERTVDRLWAITEDLNILYKENWTKLAARELLDFQQVLMQSVSGGGGGGGGGGEPRAPPAHRWTFSGSFLYALTLITTIGHGGVSPGSAAGKLAAVAYACGGIPLVLLYLSAVGEALARGFRALYARLRRPHPHPHPHLRDKPPPPPPPPGRTPFQAALELAALGGGPHRTCGERARVPLPLGLLPAVLYAALGALLFHETERWDFVDGCYFSFSSLATIGFGSLRPGAHAHALSAAAEDLALGACCLYILVGMLVVAMCFDLVREDVSGVLRGMSALCAAGGARARAVHGAPADKLAAATS